MALDPIDSGWVTLTHRRIYILPTARGGAVFAALAVCAITAMNYTANLVFALAFLLLGFFLVCLHATFFQLYGLRLRLAPSKLCVLGEALPVELDVTEAAGRTRTMSAALSPNLGIALSTFEIPPLKQSALRLNAEPRRRGRLPIGRITLSSTAPAGLFRAWSYFHTDDVAWIAPAPERDPPNLTSAVPDDEPNGNSPPDLTRLPSSDSVDGLREARVGDTPRRIDWRRLARGGTLATRVGDAEAHVPNPGLDLRYDLLPELSHEARLSRLCAWVLAAKQSEARLKLSVPGRIVDWGQGKAHATACLQVLAETP